MTRKTYVTTSIPYVNAPPHVGHALELVQADAIARYSRLTGRETTFQTGTDENAFKNVEAARERGIPTQQLVDENSRSFRILCGALAISHDNFIRTTEHRHRSGVFEFWRRLRPQDVYKAAYRGLYCSGCEDFYLQKDLIDGRCPDHGTPPSVVEEENYFFRLSAYQAEIEELLVSGRLRIIPRERRNEVLAFVKRGLEDFSISREATRASGWGIPVPGDPSQVIYVWVDALINYVSGLGFGSGKEWRGFWSTRTRKVHVIGKNVWKFHAVYWPSMLLSAGLPLPDALVVHGFLTVDGQKISKSTGNAVDPLEYVRRCGQNAVRYYLLRAVQPFEDGDFSGDRLAQLYDRDLANGIGNLLSRLTALGAQSGYGRFDADGLPEAPAGYHKAMECYRFDRALSCLWDTASELNRDIERVKPWESLKRGATRPVRKHLSYWLGELYRVGYWLRPLLPNAGEQILETLSRDPICACEPLFPRLR
jgi:methionyl-tRNA synthetase